MGLRFLVQKTMVKRIKMVNMKNLVSIIVPVYKVEKYIKECIDSILNQTYKNLEIILVDDGSPDKCPYICDEYARKDSRIKVIHKENGGLSSARNLGIDIAQGDYIQFVDSDDLIDSRMTEILFTNLINTNSDISCCCYYYSEKKSENINDKPETIKEFTSFEAIRDLYCKKLQNVISWNKLYRKSLFQEIRFPVGKICEDVFTIYKLFFISKKIVKSSFIGYFYRASPNSITHNFSKKRLDVFEGYLGCHAFFSDKNISEYCYDNAVCALTAIMRFYCETNDKDIRKTLVEYFNVFYKILKSFETEENKNKRMNIRCFIFHYMRFINTFLIRFLDFYRKNKYKNNPKIMG